MLKRRKSEHLGSKDALTRVVDCLRCGELMHIAGYSVSGTCWKCTHNSANRLEKQMSEESENSEVSMVTSGKRRGRPKGSKNKPKFEISNGEVVVEKPKGKRGRPKGSKNKPKNTESTGETQQPQQS